MNEYFQTGAVPAPSSPGASSVMRQEFANIAAGFDKLPVLSGHQGEIVFVDATGSRLETNGTAVTDFVTLTGAQTVINKTIAWANNTFPGFGTGATKNAGTLADNVLLLVDNNKLPALDGSLLTNLNQAALNTVSIAKGGTGATNFAGAQANLGIDLKADIMSPAFTGAPTAPTPGLGDSSARIATTYFVTNVLDTVGATSPGDALPIMDGVASAGTPATFLVSRVDHVHPTDTTRAPSAASTATGTSVTPAGGISATDVQAALVELDTEKAPLVSPAFTGNPTAPTKPYQDTTTSIATTAFVQSVITALPPAGMYPDNDIPLMNGVGAAGVGVEASRGDHVHPSDTTKANLASPNFTGNPTAPTATPGDSSGSIASTAFVAAGLATKVGKTSSTGSALLPAGTDAQRDGAPAVGAIRFSSTQFGWEGWNGTNWVSIGGGQMLGQALVKGIFYNNQTIAENLTIASGTNGLSAGPITVDNGVTVTVSNGSTWSVV